MINQIYYKIFRNKLFAWDPAKGQTLENYSNKDRFSKLDIKTLDLIENHFDFTNKKVLDLGAGVGNYTLKFIELGANVDWVDVSKNFKKIAEEKIISIENKSTKNVNFYNIHLSNISTIKKKYDLIFNRLSWRYSFSDKKFAKDISTMLNTGGLLYIKENVWDEDNKNYGRFSKFQNLIYRNLDYKIGHPIPLKNKIKSYFILENFELLHEEFVDSGQELLFRKIL